MIKVHDHRKILRDFYEMKGESVQHLQVPSLQFVALEGKCNLDWMGLPEESGWPIYKLINQLKKITKETLGYQFKLMPHEYIWHKIHEDGQWSYTELMQVPDIINYDMYEEARRLLEKRFKNQYLPQTKLISVEQGLCAQKLHKGHSNDISRTYEELKISINNNGYRIKGDRRDILIHWCAPEPEKWETIVRVPIEQ